jgi:hypothetical protein
MLIGHGLPVFQKYIFSRPGAMVPGILYDPQTIHWAKDGIGTLAKKLNVRLVFRKEFQKIGIGSGHGQGGFLTGGLLLIIRSNPLCGFQAGIDPISAQIRMIIVW